MRECSSFIPVFICNYTVYDMLMYVHGVSFIHNVVLKSSTSVYISQETHQTLDMVSVVGPIGGVGMGYTSFFVHPC